MTDLGQNAEQIREELAKILTSPVFAGSERLSQFLAFVVEETLAGRGERIKDYVIGVEVYRKSQSFDPRTDSSVRTEASRLRSKLARYYETDGHNDKLIISIPKGTYVPIFTARELGVAECPPAVSSGRTRRTLLEIGFAGISIPVAVWLGFSREKQPNSAPEVSPLTTFPGHERNPSFNPDGTQIAFSWDGGVHEGNENIYVKVVGPDEPVRLTNNKAREFGTAWSPDGRFVTFLRFTGFGRAEIIAVPALGGSERKLGETSSINTPGFFPGHQLAWTPDGKWLCFADRGSSDQVDGLFLMSVATGEKRRMTTAPSTAYDRGPSFSPDGRWLAFCRVESLGVNDIYLLRLTPAYRPGEIRRITSLQRHTSDVGWMPRSDEVLFTSGAYESDRAIFRTKISGANSAQQLVPSGEDAYDLSISRDGRRVAYTKRLQDVNIWRAELDNGRVKATRSFITSTRNDQVPRISPDGRRIAFSSGRSGTREIWVSDADGTNALQLTSMGSRLTTNPAWSPDSQQLAFDSRLTGPPHIFVMSVRGGAPRQLTYGSEHDIAPSWSHDGGHIYYRSGEPSNWRIWKVPSSGGKPTAITRHGSLWPKESVDGNTLFYVNDEKLWKMPASGGKEELVIDEPMDDYNFAISATGVYFIPAFGTKLRESIRCFRFATGKAEQLMPLNKSPGLGLSVSPDERWLLWSQFDQEGSDIMLIDNFR